MIQTKAPASILAPMRNECMELGVDIVKFKFATFNSFQFGFHMQQLNRSIFAVHKPSGIYQLIFLFCLIARS